MIGVGPWSKINLGIQNMVMLHIKLKVMKHDNIKANS